MFTDVELIFEGQAALATHERYLPPVKSPSVHAPCFMCILLSVCILFSFI